MTTGPAPMCLCCIHLRRDEGRPFTEAAYVCDAFPGGIPAEILEFRFDHREPHVGDNGIQFEPDEEGLPDYMVEILGETPPRRPGAGRTIGAMSLGSDGDPAVLVRKFEYVDERIVKGADGTLHDVLDAIGDLPWVRQWCPFMPHEYAILSKSPEQAWYIVEAMIRLSPHAYRAFFRGYQSANRYWEAPDGRRYWRSRFEIDRWDASDTEGLRRRDQGAHAIKDWVGPPHAPNGAGYYVEGRPGKWWPSAKFFAAGYEPCRACQIRPRDLPIT